MNCDKCSTNNGITCAIYCLYADTTKNVCKQCKSRYPVDYCHCCIKLKQKEPEMKLHGQETNLTIVVDGVQVAGPLPWYARLLNWILRK